jgi:hypothetical protein
MFILALVQHDEGERLRGGIETASPHVRSKSAPPPSLLAPAHVTSFLRIDFFPRSSSAHLSSAMEPVATAVLLAPEVEQSDLRDLCFLWWPVLRFGSVDGCMYSDLLPVWVAVAVVVTRVFLGGDNVHRCCCVFHTVALAYLYISTCCPFSQILLWHFNPKSFTHQIKKVTCEAKC